MRKSSIVLGLALVMLAAACGGGDEAEPEAQDGGSSPEASVDGCEGIQIVAGSGAAGSGFTTDDVEVEAGGPFTICFENKDEGVPHSVAISSGHEATPIFSGEVVEGPTVVAYEVEALDPMEYHFHCEVHPDTMQGTLSVV